MGNGGLKTTWKQNRSPQDQLKNTKFMSVWSRLVAAAAVTGCALASCGPPDSNGVSHDGCCQYTDDHGIPLTGKIIPEGAQCRPYTKKPPEVDCQWWCQDGLQCGIHASYVKGGSDSKPDTAVCIKIPEGKSCEHDSECKKQSHELP